MKCCCLRRSLRCSRDCASCCSWPNHLGALAMCSPLWHDWQELSNTSQICFGFLVTSLAILYSFRMPGRAHQGLKFPRKGQGFTIVHHVSPGQSHVRWNHHGPWWSWWNGKVHVHRVRKDQGCHKHVWQIGLSCQGLLWWSPSRSLGTLALTGLPPVRIVTAKWPGLCKTSQLISYLQLSTSILYPQIAIKSLYGLTKNWGRLNEHAGRLRIQDYPR